MEGGGWEDFLEEVQFVGALKYGGTDEELGVGVELGCVCVC